jgi:hypothetical protein
MATTNGKSASQSDDSVNSRSWNEFAYLSFARIVARKHDMVLPDVDFSTLSDEELTRRVRLLSELAHLPPA